MLFEEEVVYPRDTPGWDVPQGERIVERWRRTPLSHIWIPSRLLPHRHERRCDSTVKSVFHMLQRYEAQEFSNSFSVYSDSDSEKGDSESGSEEEYFHDYVKKLRSTCGASIDLPSDPRDESCTLEDNGSPLKSRTNASEKSGLSLLFTDSLDRCSYENLVLELPDGSSLAEGARPRSSDVIPTSPRRLSDYILEEASDRRDENDVMECGNNKDSDISPLQDQNLARASPECLPVVEAEFVYGKKTSRDDTAYEKKMGSKKEKRNKSKSKTTMPLDHFWQTVDSEAFPLVDEFYESVMREQGHRAVRSVNEFPRLRVPPEDVWGWNEGAQSRLDDGARSRYDVETCIEEKEWTESRDAGLKVEDLDEKVGGKVLVMANIPEEVEEELVISLVSDYGQLIAMKKSGEFSTAEFWIPPDVELDWLISCFDGHQPFGAYSSVLHCYEKDS